MDRAYSRAMSEPDLRYEGAGYQHGGGDPYLQRFQQQRNQPRYFIALYDYDPRHMSPNPNAVVEELTFRKGAILKVNRTSTLVATIHYRHYHDRCKLRYMDRKTWTDSIEAN